MQEPSQRAKPERMHTIVHAERVAYMLKMEQPIWCEYYYPLSTAHFKHTMAISMQFIFISAKTPIVHFLFVSTVFPRLGSSSKHCSCSCFDPTKLCVSFESHSQFIGIMCGNQMNVAHSPIANRYVSVLDSLKCFMKISGAN